MSAYGKKPKELAVIPLTCDELMFYQYMPIKMVGELAFQLEQRLVCFHELIRRSAVDFVHEFGNEALREHYVYLTAKCMYVGPTMHMNRPGYHCDGFLTPDINYIWSDCLPTVFNRGPFEVEANHHTSLAQFEEQALVMGEFSYAPNTLLRLDQFSVHRPAVARQVQMRTFFKLSFSRDRYNLKGNTHNHLLDYQWDMVERNEQRNHTSK